MPMPASPAESGGKGGGAGKTPGRMVGSAFAGFSELLLFHPVDTVAKRLMTKEVRRVTLRARERPCRRRPRRGAASAGARARARGVPLAERRHRARTRAARCA